MLPANGNTYIYESVATLVLGDICNPVTNDIALWSAIMTDQQDFAQGVTQKSPENKEQHGNIFYASTKIADQPYNTAAAHSWEDITVILNQADQSFKLIGDWKYRATGGAVSTTDNGKTWKFLKLNIPDMVVA